MSAASTHASESGESLLLAPDEPPAFERYGRGGGRPVVICCDHASNRVPRALGTLGLPAESLARHIAWDIGAAALARKLADRLGVVAILANYSRLVIDCNRQLDDPTSIAEHSDGEAVPGNVGLSAEQRHRRIRSCFRPYQEAVDIALSESTGALAAQLQRASSSSDDVEAMMAAPAPALISVHSFTPFMRGGAPRPWQCGVLWKLDARIAAPLIHALRAEPGLVVGDNEPYSGRYPAGYTIDTHAECRGLPSVSLEIRQDLIDDEAGAARWADRLTAALEPILADPQLYRVDSGCKTSS